ncbi:hypothetical protein K3495_g3360 [Podosphaera aphanis]|nr:hypothetical protein K3495_g3360 [Podosphaera aphanis]
MPDIKDAEGLIHTEASDKARVMAGNFFPQPVAADTTDIARAIYPEELSSISKLITHMEVEEALRKLPNDKDPGPDGLPNRLPKQCGATLSKDLAELFNACFNLGYHPKGFKESTTIVLRKPQKPKYDTLKAYRPIALLNTMDKLLEKLVANRISKAAEDFNLLPGEQMGAHPTRSTISAVELLTEQIHTIWGTDKQQVASLLSLDISGAFDNVSHERLIHNLRQKGIPRWISRFVESFLEELLRKSLKIITGAYNFTSCRVLEHESTILPIEIFLKQRRVQHAGLLDKLPVQQTIQAACKKIKSSTWGRRSTHASNRSKDVAEWTRICGKEKSKGRQKEAEKIAAFEEWEKSWTGLHRVQHSTHRTPADPKLWKAATITIDKNTGRKKMTDRGTPSNIHQNLSRAQSSIAIQMRSEHIGLNSYLHRRKVPGVANPKCQCGYPSQNVKHMVLACHQWAEGRGEILRQAKDRSYEAMMKSPDDVARITQWILNKGWFEQFRLAREVEAVLKDNLMRAGKG